MAAATSSSSRRRGRGRRQRGFPIGGEPRSDFGLERDTDSGPLSFRDEGRIIYNPSTNSVKICIKRYTNFVWVPLYDLTQAKFDENRGKIASVFTSLCEEMASGSNPMASYGQRKSSKHTSDCVSSNEDDFKLLSEIYDTLKPEHKETLKAKYPESSFIKNRCTCCDSYMSSHYKCIHSDCVGMCKTCHGNSIASGVEKCPACKQEQKLECPICLATKCPDDMLMSKHCCHGICLACFADSYRSGKAVKKCPMCRGNFH